MSNTYSLKVQYRNSPYELWQASMVYPKVKHLLVGANCQVKSPGWVYFVPLGIKQSKQILEKSAGSLPSTWIPASPYDNCNYCMPQKQGPSSQRCAPWEVRYQWREPISTYYYLHPFFNAHLYAARRQINCYASVKGVTIEPALVSSKTLSWRYLFFYEFLLYYTNEYRSKGQFSTWKKFCIIVITCIQLAHNFLNT